MWKLRVCGVIFKKLFGVCRPFQLELGRCKLKVSNRELASRTAAMNEKLRENHIYVGHSYKHKKSGELYHVVCVSLQHGTLDETVSYINQGTFIAFNQPLDRFIRKFEQVYKVPGIEL